MRKSKKLEASRKVGLQDYKAEKFMIISTMTKNFNKHTARNKKHVQTVKFRSVRLITTDPLVGQENILNIPGPVDNRDLAFNLWDCSLTRRAISRNWLKY